MITSRNLSKKEKERLATDLEKERDKIVVSSKPSKLTEAKKSEIKMLVKQEEQERKSQLQRAFRNERNFVRFLYKFKGMLSHAPAEELYQEALLQELRTKIFRATRSNVLSSGSKISGKFVARLYRAYAEANAYRDTLSTIFKDPQIIELYIRYAFKNLFQDIRLKRELSDLINLDELCTKIENVQDSSQAEADELEAYLTVKRAEIRRYARDINPAFIAEVSKSLNELYHFYLFANFDYKKFFTTMGGTIKSFKSGNFDDVPLSASMKGHLENFYQYVPRLAGLWAKDTSPARYVFAAASIVVNQHGQGTFEDLEQIAQKDPQGYMKKLTHFSKSWTTDICNYPFPDLIRLASYNSFYRPKVQELPKVNVKTRVKKCVEQQLLFELELFVNNINEEYNSEAQQKLLMNYGESSMLEYYSPSSVMNPGRFHGIPGFAHVAPVNMLNNFLLNYYLAHIKKVSVHVVRSILPKSSSLRTALLNQNIRMDNLRDRIRNFNTSLNPENPWGRNLMNIVYRLEKKDTGNLLRQIKEQLREIDAEAENLLQQGLVTMQDGVEQFQALLTSKNAKIKDAMAANLPDTQISLQVAVENAIYAFRGIANLIRSHL